MTHADGRAFHGRGPATEKFLSRKQFHVRGTPSHVGMLAERSCRPPESVINFICFIHKCFSVHFYTKYAVLNETE